MRAWRPLASAAAGDTRRRRRPGGSCAKRRGRSAPRSPRSPSHATRSKVPLLVCAMGETTGARPPAHLAEAGMAVFATPEQAVRGFLHLVQDRRNRAAARELPPGTVLTVAPDRDAVRDVFAGVRRAGRLATMQDEALAVLCAYGIPVVPNRAAASPEDAADGGGVAGLPRRGEAAPERAPGCARLRRAGARSARRRAKSLPPPGGLPCAPMPARSGCWCSARRSAGANFGSASTDDATFGPIISFGQGGTTADIAARRRRRPAAAQSGAGAWR